jgi:hypothetical protein
MLIRYHTTSYNPAAPAYLKIKKHLHPKSATQHNFLRHRWYCKP